MGLMKTDTWNQEPSHASTTGRWTFSRFSNTDGVREPQSWKKVTPFCKKWNNSTTIIAKL